MKPKKLLPWIPPREPEPEQDSLTDDEKKEIQRAAGKELDTAAWDNIEGARRDWAWCCWGQGQAAQYGDLENRLVRLDAAASAILGCFGNNKTPPSGPTTLTADGISLWFQLNESDPLPFDIKELFVTLGQLRRSVRMGREKLKQSDTHAWQNDWNLFINQLASTFENVGLPVTAAKSSRAMTPKQSRFVAFVCAVMGTLPPHCQKHSHSPEALAKAVSGALSARAKATIAGPITSTS